MPRKPKTALSQFTPYRFICDVMNGCEDGSSPLRWVRSWEQAWERADIFQREWVFNRLATHSQYMAAQRSSTAKAEEEIGMPAKSISWFDTERWRIFQSTKTSAFHEYINDALPAMLRRAEIHARQHLARKAREAKARANGTCVDHPKYKAIHYPRVSCNTCLSMWRRRKAAA